MGHRRTTTGKYKSMTLKSFDIRNITATKCTLETIILCLISSKHFTLSGGDGVKAGSTPGWVQSGLVL